MKYIRIIYSYSFILICMCNDNGLFPLSVIYLYSQCDKISIDKSKRDVAPLLTYWHCVSFTQTYWYMHRPSTLVPTGVECVWFCYTKYNGMFTSSLVAMKKNLSVKSVNLSVPFQMYLISLIKTCSELEILHSSPKPYPKGTYRKLIGARF